MKRNESMIRCVVSLCMYSICCSGLFVAQVFAEPRKPKLSKDALAASSFRAVERQRVALNKLHFVGNAVKDRATLKKLVKTSRALRRAYQKVVQLKSPTWSQAAMFRVGQLYLNMAEKIREAPQPTIFSATAAKAHKQFIENIAISFETPALAIFSKAIQHATKNAISNRWVQLTKKHQTQLLAAQRNRNTSSTLRPRKK